MAKTAKVKKRQVTVHSRAARRAASPSLNLDPSAKPTQTKRSSVSPSRPSTINPHALAAKDAGIIKKQKKSNLTRGQRIRQQKGLERAADNMDKLESKRLKSLGKEKVVKERAKGWEDINEEGLKKKKTKLAELSEGGERKKDREWVSDEEMDESAPVVGEDKVLDTVVPESVPLPVEEDELL
ncbi:hypothetical protein ACN47E_001964 [Coniothyrium glycines]